MENTTQLFLAVRFNCNKCHDHPFEKWTQDQYFETSAFFAQVGRVEDPKYKGQKIGGTAVEGAKPLVEVISDAKGGEIKHDRTGQTFLSHWNAADRRLRICPKAGHSFVEPQARIWLQGQLLGALRSLG